MRELLFKRKGEFFIYVMACVLPMMVHVATQYILGNMVDSIFTQKGEKFADLVIVYFLLILLWLVLCFASRMFQIKFVIDTILDVRMNAFEKIFCKSYRQFSEKSKEVYISNLVNDINVFEQQFFGCIEGVIVLGAAFIISILIMLFVDLKLAAAVVIMSIVLFYISKSFQRKTIELQEKVSHANEVFTVEMGNTLNGIDILKLNNAEKRSLSKNLKSMNFLHFYKFKYEVFIGGQRGVSEFLINIFFVGILSYLLNMIFSGGDIGTVMFLMNITLLCILPSGRSMPLINGLKASSRIYEKITERNERVDDIRWKKSFCFENDIEVKGLKFSYEGKEIFRDADFKIEKGKKYLIRGESGAGKSTLLKILSKGYGDYEGRISIDGMDYKEIDEKSFNDNTSFIYQDVFLFEDTILNNISLHKMLSRGEVMEAAKKAGLSKFLIEREDGLDTVLWENGKNLSGGQKQRISIARALAKKAAIIFVDEGTSSLDEELGKSVERTILDQDITVISASHRYYKGVTENYDYVIEIGNGRVEQYECKRYFKEVVIL